MPRIRPVRTLTAALSGTAALWAAGVSDPAWAESVGVDVWNIGRLEADLRESSATGRRWDERLEQRGVQMQRNELLAAAVWAGRPLPGAAAQLWAENRADSGFRYAVEYTCPGPTTEARAASNLIGRVDRQLVERATPDQRAAVLARLRAEYEAAYGEPVGSE